MKNSLLRWPSIELGNWARYIPFLVTLMGAFIALEIYTGYRALDYNIVQGDSYYFQQLIHNFTDRFVYEVSYVWSRAEQQANVVWRGEHQALIDRLIVTGVWFYWLPYKLFQLPLTNYYTTLVLVLSISVFAIKRINTTLGGDGRSFAGWSMAFLAAPLINGLGVPLLRQKNYIEALNLPCLFLIISLLLPFLMPRTIHETGSDQERSRFKYYRDYALLIFSFFIILGFKEDAILVVVCLWGVLSILAKRPGFLLFSAIGLGVHFAYKKLYFPYLWATEIVSPKEYIDGLTAFVIGRILNLSFDHFAKTVFYFTAYTFPLVPVVIVAAVAAFRRSRLKVFNEPAGQMAIAACVCLGVPFSGMLLRDYGARNYCMAVPLLITAGMGFTSIWAKTLSPEKFAYYWPRIFTSLALVAVPVIALAFAKSGARSVRYLLHPNPLFSEFEEVASKITPADSIAVCDGNARYSFVFAMRAKLYPCAAITAKKPDYVVIFKNLTDDEDIQIQKTDLEVQAESLRSFKIVLDLPGISLLKRDF